VPWCPSCQRFLSPPTVAPDGTCPSCGRPVEPGRAKPPAGPPSGDEAGREEEELPPIPAHLKYLGIALVIYLGYRFWQGIEWVIHKF
jgi:hypothetical protein